MPTLTSLTVNLRGDSSSLVKASRTGLRAIRGLRDGVAGTVLKIGALGGAITGLVGAAGLVGLAQQSRTSVDAIGKLSTQLGVSATDVQKLTLVAELSGIGIEDLSKSFQRVTRLAGDFQAGGKEAGEVFRRLGLSMKDIDDSSPLELFSKVITALGKIESFTERASIGNKLFEEQWQRLTPLIDGFNESMKRAAVVYDELGFGIDKVSARLRDYAKRHNIDLAALGFPDLAKGVENLNDNLTVAQILMKDFRNLIFAKVAPVIDSLVVKVGRMAEAWVRSAGGADKLADSIVGAFGRAIPRAIEWVWDLAVALEELRITMGGLGAGLDAIGQAVGGAAAIARDLPRGGAAVNAVFPGMAARSEEMAAGKTVDELERQTRLLQDIRNLNFGMVFN